MVGNSRRLYHPQHSFCHRRQLGLHLSPAYFLSYPQNIFVRTELLSLHWGVSVLVNHPLQKSEVLSSFGTYLQVTAYHDDMLQLDDGVPAQEWV